MESISIKKNWVKFLLFCLQCNIDAEAALHRCSKNVRQYSKKQSWVEFVFSEAAG